MNNLQVTKDEIEDLKSLLYALNWFNNEIENKSSITPVLIEGINPITKEPITEFLEVLNNISFHRSSIKDIFGNAKEKGAK